MKTKICTKCKKELPNNENYFHLDSSKVRLGHLVVLARACKVCKNERKRIQSVTYRNKIAAEFGTNYQKRKLDDPMFLEKCKVREKKYNEKKNERNRKRWNTIPEVREKHLALNKKRTLKEVAELPDYYIARLVTRNSKILKPNDILNQKEFIETYRENLKLKRLCRQ